jgi:integrase/recombinase XerD
MKVSLPWLRHSYSTHLLERRTDLLYNQELPGYKSSRTTEIYTHVSQKRFKVSAAH